MPFTLELSKILLHVLNLLPHVLHSRLRCLGPIMMRRHRKEEDFRDKVVAAIDLISIELICGLLIGIDLGLVRDVDPRASA